jgi:UDP:flavonoid glycosyltransferase YjiC (YdhE family)
MAVFLAYVEPVPGRLYPLVSTLQELVRRGHRVTVRTGIKEVELLRSIGIDGEPLAPELVRFEPEDWRARTRFGALVRGLAQFGERAPFQVPDLQHAIATEHPDVLLIDETSWGAAAAAERSGLPWAFCIPSPVPLPSRDAPPFGVGLAPRHDAVGRVRDRIARPVVLGSLAHIIASHVNGLRLELGVAPMRTVSDFYLAATLLLAYTAEPFEYPRSDWPAKVRLVGPGLWEPPAEHPPWLADLHQPLVLVNCSTLFQNDRQIVGVACNAFAGQPFDAVISTGDIDPAGFHPPTNVRIERFIPHTPVLEHAACVVCHAGMGITQKALAQAGIRLPAQKLQPGRLLQAVRHAIELRPGAQRIAAAFASLDTPTLAANALEQLAATNTAKTGAQPVGQPVA